MTNPLPTPKTNEPTLQQCRQAVDEFVRQADVVFDFARVLSDQARDLLILGPRVPDVAAQTLEAVKELNSLRVSLLAEGRNMVHRMQQLCDHVSRTEDEDGHAKCDMCGSCDHRSTR